jgi:hypothetical protein
VKLPSWKENKKKKRKKTMHTDTQTQTILRNIASEQCRSIERRHQIFKGLGHSTSANVIEMFEKFFPKKATAYHSATAVAIYDRGVLYWSDLSPAKHTHTTTLLLLLLHYLSRIYILCITLFEVCHVHVVKHVY